MSLPSREDFEYAITLKPWNEMLQWLSSLYTKEFSDSDIENTAKDALDRQKTAYKAFSDLDAVKWLSTQPAFQMAMRKLFDAELTDSVFMARIKRLIQRARSRKSGYIYSPEAIMPAGAVWIEKLLIALHDYLYKDHASQIAESKANVVALIDSSEQFVTALEIANSDPFLSSFYLPQFRNPKKRYEETRRDSVLELIARLKIALEENCIYPSTRIDKTLRERMFIHAMCRAHDDIFSWNEYIGPEEQPDDWFVNRKYWVFHRNLYPDVISDLLYLDGIENQIDVRRVEEHCKIYKMNATKRYRAKNTEINTPMDFLPKNNKIRRRDK